MAGDQAPALSGSDGQLSGNYGASLSHFRALPLGSPDCRGDD